MQHPELSIVTWNVEWRQVTSIHADIIRNRIWSCEPDVICLTEAYADFLGEGGYVVEADPDYGYPLVPGRRKVLLWSRQPWGDVERIGHPELPSGRYAEASTVTALGPVAVIGACIPWPDAHVRTGRRDRAKWEDHLAYLSALAGIVGKKPTPTILLGDFNQRIPRSKVPIPVYDALHRAVLSTLHVATAGPIGPAGEQAIDHVAHSVDFLPTHVRALSNIGPNGEQLSDHFGVHVVLHRSERREDIRERDLK